MSTTVISAANPCWFLCRFSFYVCVEWLHHYLCCPLQSMHSHMASLFFFFFYTLVMNLGGGGGVYWNHCVHVSVSPSVCLSRFCLDDISWTAQPFVTKLSMVVYYHKMECHAEKLFCCLQGQGHSKDLCNQNMTVYTISSTFLICLQPNLFWWYIISWSVM